MKNIVVIGAGFSGAIIAARLLNETCSPSCVYLVNGSGRIARGMAYGTQSMHHVLNVPAGNMSAYEECPAHFLDYARRIDPSISGTSFVTRRIYGDYLEWLLNDAERNASSQVKLQRIYRQVTGVRPVSSGSGLRVAVEDGKHIVADRVVLALGHHSSTMQHLSGMIAQDDECYLHDPWDHARLDSIPAWAPVLLLGTGLTAVDVMMTLLDRNPQRRITAVSRRGLVPRAHRQMPGPQLKGGAELIWGEASGIRAQLHAFRNFCRARQAEGGDWRDGLALLRPLTADLWMSYTDKERRRFLRHLQPYWDSHRHRLAPEVARRFDTALQAGVIRTMAGRVVGIDKDSDGMRISMRPRGGQQVQVERSRYVINCTGPCADPREADSLLVQQLLTDGFIRRDGLGLGIDVAPDCGVISINGEPAHNLFYIGPWLKAAYWEATAVPDLRVIARKLASRVLED